MFDIRLAGRGWGFIVLNIIRACNMAVLTTIAIAAIIFMIVGGLPNAWIFFSDVFLACVVAMCTFLALSETQLFSGWIQTFWPAFGPTRGLNWLAYSMMIMASHLLGKMSDERFSQKKMGPVFWNVCLAAGILGYIFGVVNLFTSWFWGYRLGRYIRVFRSTGRSEARANPKTGLPKDKKAGGLPQWENESIRSNDSMDKSRLPAYPGTTYPGSNAVSRAASQRSAASAGPYGRAPMRTPSHGSGRGTPSGAGAGKVNDDNVSSCSDGDDRVALDDNVSQLSVPSRQQQMSPIAPGLIRPDSFLHPAHPAHRRAPSNTYSVASHFTGWGGGRGI